MPATASPQAPAASPAVVPPSPAAGPDPRRAGQVSEGLRKWRKLKSGLIAAACFLCAVIVITPLALVFGYLVSRGFSALNWAFLTQLPGSPDEPGGGVVQAILGTFGIVGLASVIGIPTGVLGALYLTEYASPRVAALVRFAADLLNGVPSIVWGIVAYALFVLPHARGGSFLSLGQFLLPGRLRRAGVHHDPAGPADGGGGAAPRSRRLPRGRAGPGHRPVGRSTCTSC